MINWIIPNVSDDIKRKEEVKNEITGTIILNALSRKSHENKEQHKVYKKEDKSTLSPQPSSPEAKLHKKID